MLKGARGKNIYIWNLGDENDVLHLYGYDAEGKFNTLQFGEGILPNEVHVSRTDEEGDDFCFVVEKTGERITVKGGYSFYSRDVRNAPSVVFADGTTWTPEDIRRKGFVYKGGDGDDTVTGFCNADD